MLIGKSYTRIDPNGHKTTITIKNQEQLEYYKSLVPHGYEFKAKLVIHNNLEPCESCSA